MRTHPGGPRGRSRQKRERPITARAERHADALLRRTRDRGVDVGALVAVEALHPRLRVGGEERAEHALEPLPGARPHEEARSPGGDHAREGERFPARQHREELRLRAWALFKPPGRNHLGEPARRGGAGAR